MQLIIRKRKKAQAAYSAKAFLAVERYGVSEEQSTAPFRNKGFGTYDSSRRGGYCISNV